MFTLTIWNILGIISLILLIIFAKNKGAVWGGLAGGFIVGLIIAIIYSFRGNGFPWIILMKSAIIGILAGSAFLLIRQFIKKPNAE
ncbi:MAG TPA: hypothetical protein VF623_04890 [Segetibacter sp.]|jgi:hypothetical protein